MYIMSRNQVDVANIVHAYQTAERIREKYPDDDWLILTGFIHDLGKVMALLGEPQVWQPVSRRYCNHCYWVNYRYGN